MLGITVLPEYLQSEGPEALLDNLLKRLPVTAISTSPYVMEECPPEEGGQREPPADSNKGLVRLLDRPLWGKREIWVNTTPSFEPDRKRYQGLRYQPQEPTDLTDKEGPVIDQFIKAAHDRGIKVYFQIMAAIPPGYRVQFGGPGEDDLPRLPDGSVPTKRLDNNGSLASPRILDYGAALTRDLLTRYPDIDGLRLDWPEYPPYFLETTFLDFGKHAKAFAERKGFDFEMIRTEVGSLYDFIRRDMTDSDLQAYLESGTTALGQRNGCQQWLALKAAMVNNLLENYRSAMNSTGGERKSLFPSAFPPPWNHLSGFDYSSAGKIADAISCKYYTMHWPMMLRNYSDSIQENNTRVSSGPLAQFLANVFDATSPIPADTRGFNYPKPDEKHPVELETLSRRQMEVEKMSNGTAVWPITHSYGPLEDFIERARAVFSVSKNRLWINRYAYLSEDKLDALGELFK